MVLSTTTQGQRARAETGPTKAAPQGEKAVKPREQRIGRNQVETLYACILTVRGIPSGEIREMVYPLLTHVQTEMYAVDYFSRLWSTVESAYAENQMELVSMRVSEFHHIRVVKEITN